MAQLRPLIIKAKVTITHYNITNVCKLLHNMSRPNGHAIRPKHSLGLAFVCQLVNLEDKHDMIMIGTNTMKTDRLLSSMEFFLILRALSTQV